MPSTQKSDAHHKGSVDLSGRHVKESAGDQGPSASTEKEVAAGGRWSRKSLVLFSCALTLAVFSLDLVTAEWTTYAGYEISFYVLALVSALCYMKLAAVGKAQTPTHAAAPRKAQRAVAAPSGGGQGPLPRKRQTAQQKDVQGNGDHLPRNDSVSSTAGPLWPAPPPELSTPSCASVGSTASPHSRDPAQSISQTLVNAGPGPASRLLEQFESEGWESDVATHNRIIRSFAKRGDLARAEQWLVRMRDTGRQPDEDSYLIFMTTYARSDDAQSAEAWMSRLRDAGVLPSIMSYGVLIDLHARLGDVVKATEWLRRMIEAGLTPDTNHYNLLIHACSQKLDVEGAEKFLQEMLRMNLKASVKTYTALVDVCAKSLDVKGAERWMQEMKDLEIEPNVVSYSAMINACAKVGDLGRAERWYTVMQEQGVQPNAYSYSGLINACAQAGDVESACSWLERAECAGTGLDGVVYGCVINACGKVGDAERATEVFSKMKAQGMKSHIVVYAALARPFAYRGDWAEVERIRDVMLVEDGIKMNDYFLYTLLLAYSRARPREARRAEAEFRNAIEGGIAANENLIKALSAAVGKAKCAQLVGRYCPHLKQ